MTRKDILIVGVALIIGVIGLGLARGVKYGNARVLKIFRFPSTTPAAVTPVSETFKVGNFEYQYVERPKTSETAQPVLGVQPPAKRLEVENQAAGSEVGISSLVLTAPSWVAIRDVSNGALGNVLGAAWFPVSAKTGTVPLLRATQAGKSYAAVLYADDGDRQFDLHKDKILENSRATFDAR